MPEFQAPRFISTQARILITEWQALAKLIVSHSVPAKDKPITNIEDLESFDIENLENITFSTADELPNILSEKQVQTALQGPYGNLIREKMRAYSRIARFRLEMHLSKEELFKNKRATLAEQEQIPVKKLDKLSFTQLDQIQSELDNLTAEHDQQWREFIEEWSDHLIQFLNQTKLSLTERETKEFQDEDIATEILPRFIEVSLKLPKKDYAEMSCVDYLHLKALLTIQSALSRQHLAHDDNEIQQKLKDFKSMWSEMEKQEKALLENQKQLTEQVLSAL